MQAVVAPVAANAMKPISGMSCGEANILNVADRNGAHKGCLFIGGANTFSQLEYSEPSVILQECVSVNAHNDTFILFTSSFRSFISFLLFSCQKSFSLSFYFLLVLFSFVCGVTYCSGLIPTSRLYGNYFDQSFQQLLLILY